MFVLQCVYCWKVMIKRVTEAQVLSFFKRTYSRRSYPYLGLYNSQLGGIITDEALMLIPVDDRTAIRGHGVFDVFYMNQTHIQNIDSHIDRLFNSAQSVNIVPPFTKEKTKAVLIEVVEEIVDYHLRNDPKGDKKQKILNESIGIRVMISSGNGDLSVASLNKEPVLYILVFEPYISYDSQKKGVNEFLTKVVDQVKSNPKTKSVDYTENALMANQSKKRGGYQGIKMLKNGVLLQAACANIAFIFGKEFATPSFDYVVNGTTIKKILAYLEELKLLGIIDKISFRDITLEQAYSADQMMVLGGDKVVPVLNFDDYPISFQRGPITTRIQEWYESTLSLESYQVQISPELL